MGPIFVEVLQLDGAYICGVLQLDEVFICGGTSA